LARRSQARGASIPLKAVERPVHIDRADRRRRGRPNGDRTNPVEEAASDVTDREARGDGPDTDGDGLSDSYEDYSSHLSADDILALYRDGGYDPR